MHGSSSLPLSTARRGTMSRAHELAVLVVYTLTIFVSATLLFLIQPMFARMVLPLLGGAPAVWNTAQVFYQGTLLLGYGYAHLAGKWLSPRKQAVLHLAILLVPLVALPIAVPLGWTPPTASNPLPWLLALMLVAVGLPFFVVSTNGPTLQRWFVGTGHRSAGDPYFLYAASNLGSMLALLSYPVLLEPLLRLNAQSTLWTGGYGLLVVLMFASAYLLWRAPAAPAPTATAAQAAALPTIGLRRRLRWIALAAVPSSLMLGVTTYLSTDIAAIPLLWIAPLALYLLTFILVFAAKPPLPHWIMVRALPMLLLPLLIVIVARANQPVALLMPLHLVAFFVATMVCHGELARDRPDARLLTEFYLWMSFGGVLGGIFNALLAPLLFHSVAEYPLALVAASLLGPRPTLAAARSWLPARTLDLVYPGLLAAATVGLVLATGALGLTGPISTGLMFGIPALICFGFSRRPLRFGLGVAAILVAGTLYTGDQGRLLLAERSFFGIHRVTLSPTGNAHMLLHGSTLHGMQSLDGAQALDPLTYYYRTGPVGRAFRALDPAVDEQIGVVGMGAGSIACYGKPGQRWTFYEIDPVVERIARDPRYFTFLRDCPPQIDVVLGDARLSLTGAAPQQFSVLVLDAYSSDSIPLHLVSREALALYRSKLADHGVLLFHISNRHLDLEPVLAALAGDAGLQLRVLDDGAITAEDAAAGKTASKWVVMARTTDDMRGLADDPIARAAETSDAPVWTDDFSSLLSVFHWY